MQNYKLLTPGPLTTSKTVRQMMLEDRCTWDNDYKQLTQQIRQHLLKIAGVDEADYTSILLQGSGSYVVEAVLHTALTQDSQLLVISNGAYGERLLKMSDRMGASAITYQVPYNETPTVVELEDILRENPTITHVAMIHCETTTGILNPLEPIAKLVKQYNKTLIVDAMSSFGGVPIEVETLGIDYLISSANKCIQGVPGFGFVIVKREVLEATEGNAMSLSLDLYDQWKTMEVDGKWRFTSPTHVVAAFLQALKEHQEEGGVERRFERYQSNNQYVREQLEQLGFKAYVDELDQSPIITTFLHPNDNFSFEDFYQYMKDRGFVLYPGKLTEEDAFRIGNIGHVFKEDFVELCAHIKQYMERENNDKN